MIIFSPNLPVCGSPLLNAVEQMQSAMTSTGAVAGALMADHHLGYSVPVGGVIAWEGKVSPSAVGYDIGCGNMAVKLPILASKYDENGWNAVADKIASIISFGVGRPNTSGEDVSARAVFQWALWESNPLLASLKEKAIAQFGTVGSGNHYVDVFRGSDGYIWIGVHFGSRGLGHSIASHYIKEAGGKDGINVVPCLLDVESDLGEEYIQCMQLAGHYAASSRSWVCEKIAAEVFGYTPWTYTTTVHNHHNYAWMERHSSISDQYLWVHRKGATPAADGQTGFIGATMGENSLIVEGVKSDLSEKLLYSTVHGAGRAMSRTEAAGKSKWIHGKKVRVSEGKISRDSMDSWMKEKGVILRGGDVDEAPMAYKRLDEVIAAQGDTVRILDVLTPLVVVMAGEGVNDPYKD